MARTRWAGLLVAAALAAASAAIADGEFVRLTGYKLEADKQMLLVQPFSLSPGQEVTLDSYWEPLEPITGEVFVVSGLQAGGEAIALGAKSLPLATVGLGGALIASQKHRLPSIMLCREYSLKIGLIPSAKAPSRETMGSSLTRWREAGRVAISPRSGKSRLKPDSLEALRLGEGWRRLDVSFALSHGAAIELPLSDEPFGSLAVVSRVLQGEDLPQGGPVCTITALGAGEALGLRLKAGIDLAETAHDTKDAHRLPDRRHAGRYRGLHDLPVDGNIYGAIFPLSGPVSPAVLVFAHAGGENLLVVEEVLLKPHAHP